MNRLAVLATALALQGCNVVQISDRYGNTYGGFYDHGGQYAWQLETCDREIAAATLADPQKKRAMECCMWRHGVPIDDATACVAG